LIRFPDENKALLWYRSSEYQQLAKFRKAAAGSDIVLLSGTEYTHRSTTVNGGEWW
jgi:uncharacterized protein (DUF1330 family)